MDEAKFQSMLDAMVEKLSTSQKEAISALEAKVAELNSEMERINAENSELKSQLEAAEAEKVELNAKLEAAAIPAPTAGIQQTPVAKDKVDFSKKREEINAQNLSPEQKIQLRWAAYCEAISE